MSLRQNLLYQNFAQTYTDSLHKLNLLHMRVHFFLTLGNILLVHSSPALIVSANFLVILYRVIKKKCTKFNASSFCNPLQ